MEAVVSVVGGCGGALLEIHNGKVRPACLDYALKVVHIIIVQAT